MEREPELESPGGVRRTLTLRNSAARQVAVNFMPSRQLSYNTLRLRRTNSEHNALLEEASTAAESSDADKRAELIVREMEQRSRLMEDDPAAEEMRREALRDLAQGLTMKRTVRAKLSASVSLRSKRRPLSVWKRLKYRISFGFKRMRDRVRNVAFSMELWYEAIRDIEGHFGSAVGSYFYFLRWLFMLNLALLTLLVAFVVVPQALHDRNTAGNATVVEDTSTRSGFVDFVSGKMFSGTVMFYGHYHPGLAAAGALPYDMAFAYFFTMLCLYFASFAVLCYRTAYSYRRNFIETADGLGHAFATKLFCGWDFGIATHHAAALNANSIYLELKELLSEQIKGKVVATLCVRFGRCLANVIITALVIGSIGALQFGLWTLLVAAKHIAHWEVVVSLVITASVSLCPVVFHLVARLEFYKPRTKLYVTLARTWLLDITTLMLLLAFWARSEAPCWQTALGQEAYRLVLHDALVSLFLLPLVEALRALLYRFKLTGAAPEFNIAYNSLTVIYNQAVLWVGMLFSPLLVVAVTVKFLCLFYVKREVAVRACQPARKVWRAAQTQTIFYMLVTLSLFASLFALGSLFFWRSTGSCGPLQQYALVYEVLSRGVLRLHQRPAAARALAFLARPAALAFCLLALWSLYTYILHQRPAAARALAFLARPAALAFCLLALCVAVYYTRARARAQRGMVRLLRQMLVLQARDKEFLLAAIAKVSNGEWHYNPRGESDGPDSHTWRYLNEVRKPSNAEFSFEPSRLSHSLIEGRPRSLALNNRPNSYHPERSKSHDDGDTDSSFSWQGSSNYLNQRGDTGESDRRWL